MWIAHKRLRLHKLALLAWFGATTVIGCGLAEQCNRTRSFVTERGSARHRGWARQVPHGTGSPRAEAHFGPSEDEAQAWLMWLIVSSLYRQPAAF